MNTVHELGNGWTAVRIGKLFNVSRDGVSQFVSSRLKVAQTRVRATMAAEKFEQDKKYLAALAS